MQKKLSDFSIGMAGVIVKVDAEGRIKRRLFDMGQIFGVTRERIRQIENKAIRKLRHPSRAKKIKDFYC